MVARRRTKKRKNEKVDSNQELMELLRIVQRNLKYFFVLDITPPELNKYNYSTIRVIAPELLPMCFPALPYKMHPNYPKGESHDFFPHPLP